MPFAAVVEVSALDGTDGFQVTGEAAGLYTGRTVAAAGDLNGDGIQDFVVSASGLAVNGANSGGAYVVFGTASGFPAELLLSSLDGTNGFQINGEAGSRAGANVSAAGVASAGDINGDGIDDLIIGGPSASPNGSGSGSVWILYGKDTSIDGDFTANVELSSLTGATGFQINGEAIGNQLGAAVASAGDVNGDGINDIIIGAYRAGPNGIASGASYVVFGRNAAVEGAFAGTFELSSLDGSNGFQINGEAAGDYSGFAVSSAGDVNGDGIDDVIIGAFGSDVGGNLSGGAWVVFGTAGGFAANVELSSLDGTNGFQLSGAAATDAAGITVASAGDLNGDGFDDIVVGAYSTDANGAYSGTSYVIFGKDTSVSGDFANVVQLSALDGTDGFRINGQAGDYSGRAVMSGGDVNGDGIDDLVIGAYRAAPNGVYSGAAYVFFGHTGAFGADFNLADLTTATGVRINGDTGDILGADVSAADINGDGLVDLIFSAAYSGAGGGNSGAVYIVFGQPAVATFVGDGSDQTYTGTAAADTVSGLGGKDVLNGLGGDDVLDGGDDNDILSGGDNNDTLTGGQGNDILSGDDGDDNLDGGVGADKLFGGLGTDTLTGGDGADRLDGGAGVDTLNGGDGNDYLDGGTGADIMSGGLANDVYIVDDAGDQTIELVGEGYDIVRTALDGWVLAANIEGLELQGAGDIDGSGNELANNLLGNSGANTLSGLAGVDTINGGDGDDFIIGGTGNDLLRGGAGADSFVVLQESVGNATLEIDTIYDFSTGDGDIIDLSAIDANSLVAGNQAFSLVSSFTRHAGEMTLTFSGGQTLLKLDVNGDGKVDYQMKINGDVTGDSGGWLL